MNKAAMGGRSKSDTIRSNLNESSIVLLKLRDRS